MTNLAQSLAVCVAEITTLASATPELMGEGHPHTAIVSHALGDVATALFTALTQIVPTAPHDPTAPVDPVDPAALQRAEEVRGQQVRALRSLQELLTEIDPAPARLADFDDGIDLISGLLELDTRTR